MYSDTEQWLRIRHRILVEGVSRKQVMGCCIVAYVETTERVDCQAQCLRTLPHKTAYCNSAAAGRRSIPKCH